MEYLFVIAAAIVVYVYALFPAAMLLLACLPLPRPPRRDGLPPVTVLTAARNERALIRAKIDNVLAADYPADKLDIIVGSDGSTDGTDEEIARLAQPRLRLVRADGHVGRPAPSMPSPRKPRGRYWCSRMRISCLRPTRFANWR